MWWELDCLLIFAPVALGLRELLAESAGFFGTLGTLKAVWPEEGWLPSTESLSSKLRSKRIRQKSFQLVRVLKHYSTGYYGYKIHHETVQTGAPVS